MANEEHVRILLSGVEAWNEWRQNNPLAPDLSRAQLSGADLSVADLHGANLANADLRRADLNGANLIGAHLIESELNAAHLSFSIWRRCFADLSNADLRGADLRDVMLCGSNLTGANLNGANLDSTYLVHAKLFGAQLRGAALTGAILTGAELSDADLTNAVLGRTHLTDVSLQGIKGLGNVTHRGPSYVGIDTLERTAAALTSDPGDQHEIEDFLGRSGVPSEYIDFFRSRIGQPIQFYSCFISYSSKDQAFADRLYIDLRQKGIRCWLATEYLKIGDKFRRRINDAIRVHDKLMVVLSEYSVQSSWVEDEVEAAFEKERRDGGAMLFPIRLDEAVMDSDAAWAASIRRTRHIGDFRNWKNHDDYQRALERLIRDLRP